MDGVVPLPAGACGLDRRRVAAGGIRRREVGGYDAGRLDHGAGSGLRINTGAETGGTGTGEPAIIGRLDEGLRMNTNTNARASVFVRAIDPQEPELCADSSLITPRAGVCSYRDISIDTNALKPTDNGD